MTVHDPKQSEVGPVVITIRVSGRWVSFLTAVSAFVMLPLLAGSAADDPARPTVALAGASPQQAVAQAGSASGASSGQGSRFTGAEAAGTALGLGGGPIQFPSIGFNALTSPLATVGSPVASRPGFVSPLAGPVMSVFGPRRHPVLGRPMFHTGIDLGASCGTPVRAVADGTVVHARQSASWGNRIIVEHDPQLKTGYAHLSAFVAKEGDVVKQGDVIGLVGTTGWSTGCHLHFDVIINDRYVDPAPYLGFGPSGSTSIPYAAAPHLVLDDHGSSRLVEDGDVPIPPEASRTPVPTATTPLPGTSSGTTVPTSVGPLPTSSGTTPPTGTGSASPTTTAPSTTSPGSSGTTAPSTTTGPTTPPTTTAPTTTAPTTTAPTTTSSTPPSTPSSTTTDAPTGTSTSPDGTGGTGGTSGTSADAGTDTTSLSAVPTTTDTVTGPTDAP